MKRDPGPFELPDEMTVVFPFGYRVKVLKRRLPGRLAGDWTDYDSTRTGIIRIQRKDPYDEQLDTLRHEMEHALTDWGGRVRGLENEYRAWRKEEEQ